MHDDKRHGSLAGRGHHPIRIGHEARPLSQWLRTGRVRVGLPAILVETRHVEAALSAMRSKANRNDAHGIAQLVCLGCLRLIHVRAMPAQDIRLLLNARKLIQAKLLDIKGAVRGLLRAFGLKIGPVGTAKFERHIHELVAGQAIIQVLPAPEAPMTVGRYDISIGGNPAPRRGRCVGWGR